MTSPLAQRLCANHPERSAHALCMSCRRALCQECVTPWEGVNYCARCLAARRGARREGGHLLAWLGVVAAIALLLVAQERVLVWMGTSLTGLFE